LFTGTTSGDQRIHGSKKVLILGVTVLPFLDSCCHWNKFDVSPPVLFRALLDLLLGAKARICSGSCFDIAKASSLTVIPLQATGKGPLREELELQSPL